MPTKEEIESYLKKYNLDVQLQVAITDLVKEGMPNNPLEYVGGKLQGMGQASQLQAMGKPTLHYFDVSGRGELCKLIAAVGGVELDIVEYPFQANGASVADKLKAGDMESEHTKAATAIGMEGCGLPIVVHGDLKINQSFACQNYFASIGQNYPKTTAQQQVVDDMFQGALEDCMGLAAGVILSGYDGSLVPKIMEKVLTHLTKYIPAEGFVHGKAAPTIADLAILVLTQALIPFGATLGEGAAEVYGKFPEAVALGERAAAFPAVAKWLTNESCNLKKPPKAAPE